MISEIKKVNIFIDTNILENPNRKLYEFRFNETYDRLKSFIKYNGYNNFDFNIIIPQIVLDELNKHYIEEYERIEEKLENIDEKYNELKSDLNKIGYNFKIEKKNYFNLCEYKQYLKRKFNEYISEEKESFEIIPYPNSDKFYNIIERAVQKERPFFSGNSKGKKFSDAGFKDVIFVESIIEKMLTENADYIIVTDDNIVNGLNWNSEIKGKKGKSINFKTASDIIDFICNEYKLKNIFDYIEFSRTDYFIEKVNKAINDEIVKNSQKVNALEEVDENIVEIECTMKSGKVIKVFIDETKEFLDIYDANYEMIFQW